LVVAVVAVVVVDQRLLVVTTPTHRLTCTHSLQQETVVQVERKAVAVVVLVETLQPVAV
jgi:hypothetical protein